MRITLDIDDDVLAISRARAEREHVSIGRVLSALARAALRPAGDTPVATRNGLPVLPNAAARPVTLDLVNRLRD